MYLILTKGSSWNRTGTILRYSPQKDYDHYEAGDIEVFIYGYPYSEAKATWVSARDLHQFYLYNGLSFVDEIEGSYAIIILDKVKDRCLVIIDRYGIYNMFYSEFPDTFIISDSIGDIVSHIPSVDLNRRSIVEFLNFGWVLGTKTHIKGIEKFRSATITTITAALTSSENTYWQYLSERRGETTKDDILRLFNNHIAIGLKLEEKISVALTGGLDSRAILSACLYAKERCHCYTSGLEHSEDVRIARKICQRFDIPYDTYTIDDEWIRNIPSLADGSYEIFDGMVNIVTSLELARMYAKEADRGELLFSGVGGEMFRYPYVSQEVINSASLDDVSIALRKVLQPHAIAAFTLGSKQLLKLLEESVKRELMKAETEDPVSLAEYFYLSNRVGNFMSYSLRLASKYLKIFIPFLNGNILQKIPSLDAQERRGGGLQKYIIIQNSPGLARILLSGGRNPNQSDFQMRFQSFVTRLRIYSKVKANMIARDRWGREIFKTMYYTDYDSWLRKYHTQYVRELLDYESMFSKDLFDRGQLEAIVNSFIDSQSGLGFITNLMSLEGWLRKISNRTAKGNKLSLLQ